MRNIGVGAAVDALRIRRINPDGNNADSDGIVVERPNPAFVASSPATTTNNDSSSNPKTNTHTGKSMDHASYLVSRRPVLNRALVAFSKPGPYFSLSPGMNLTFVLNSIMNSDSGLHHFGMELFRVNDANQPLYAVSSVVRGGVMENVTFGYQDGDYWDIYVNMSDREH